MEQRTAEERIGELRAEIHRIDAELVALFERRMDTARAIGCIKRENNMGIKNEYREMEVKANCRANCKNNSYLTYAESMMKCIMGACRGIQNADAPEYDDPWKYKYLELDPSKFL